MYVYVCVFVIMVGGVGGSFDSLQSIAYFEQNIIYNHDNLFSRVLGRIFLFYQLMQDRLKFLDFLKLKLS